jgi:glucose/arabinose dehydrogenase
MLAARWIALGCSLSVCSLIATTSFAKEAPRSPTPASETGVFKVTTIAEGLEHGWGLVQLPDGRMLVSERSGRLRYVGKDGTLSAPLSGLPAIWANGQGGLLDLELSPGFKQDHLLYFSFAEPGEGNTAGTAVARGTLGEAGVESVQVIWRQTPKVESPNHFGSRIVFRPDGTLYITMGDRFLFRDRAQDLSTTLGKIVHVRADGTVPGDNPFVNRKDVLPEIWSYGHRSVQAAAVRPGTSELWTVEHGARGGDELNHPQAGRNYGWPVITYGIDYSGEKIGEGTEKAGMEQPVYYWDPVIAPSGALFYTGKAFPEWQGDLFVGSMQPGCLVRLDLEQGRVVKETRYLGELKERIRDVMQGSDGLLYLLTDAPKGRVMKLEKAVAASN